MKHEEESRKQMLLLQALMEGVQKQGEAAVCRSERDHDVRVAKLTENDNTEVYFTTFERLMIAYEVNKDKWAFKLAPQLVEKAQQAYAGLSVTDAGDYDQLKAAILRQYDITEESYRQRFRAVKPRPGESNQELAARLTDFAGKWMKACTSIDELRDLVVLEQLLNTLPEDARIFVKEMKPKTSVEAGRLADDFIIARNDDAVESGKEDKTSDRRQSF